MSVAGLEKLEVWRKAKDLVLLVYREVIPLLPSDEKWAMASQLRRSVQSVAANIAEGHGRFYFQENVHFCYIARGSLEETLTYLVLARDLGYIQNELYIKVGTDGDNLTRLINGYITYLKRARLGQNEPGSNAVHEPYAEYSLDLDEDLPRNK